jgi:hypothetical protein
MTTLTHVYRPKHSRKFNKASKARCIRENIVLPVVIIGFFGYIVLSIGGVL